MISVAETVIGNTNIAIVEEAKVSRLKPVVICGSCGAQELVIDEIRTECPHCDEYIY